MPLHVLIITNISRKQLIREETNAQWDGCQNLYATRRRRRRNTGRFPTPNSSFHAIGMEWYLTKSCFHWAYEVWPDHLKVVVEWEKPAFLLVGWRFKVVVFDAVSLWKFGVLVTCSSVDHSLLMIHSISCLARWKWVTRILASMVGLWIL